MADIVPVFLYHLGVFIITVNKLKMEERINQQRAAARGR